MALDNPWCSLLTVALGNDPAICEGFHCRAEGG